MDEEKGPLVLWAYSGLWRRNVLYGVSRWFVCVLFLGACRCCDTFSTRLRNYSRQYVTPDSFVGEWVRDMLFAGWSPTRNLGGIVAAVSAQPLLYDWRCCNVVLVALVAYFVPQLRSYQD